MALAVVNSQNGLDKFPTATVWHIDEEGYLHIAEPTLDGKVNRAPHEQRTKTRPLASFAPGRWTSVHVDRQTAGPFGNID